MLEQIIVEPGAEGDDLCVRSSLDFDGDNVERGHTGHGERLCGRAARSLVSAAKRFEHRKPRGAEAQLG